MRVMTGLAHRFLNPYLREYVPRVQALIGTCHNTFGPSIRIANEVLFSLARSIDRISMARGKKSKPPALSLPVLPSGMVVGILLF